MFHVVNANTRAAQFEGLPAAEGWRSDFRHGEMSRPRYCLEKHRAVPENKDYILKPLLNP